jgi:magnesium chelatase subunit D
MKLALVLSVIVPSVGGVLIMGQRGTGKSTAVRGLADLLPPLVKTRGCPYNCDPSDAPNACSECAAKLARGEKLQQERAPVPVVELPLGATEDRVCGTLNLERAIGEGVKAFEPGLLARANRGFLYIDEVNLLDDHLVDLLLDSSVTGRNRVEREGVSIEHPARFVLIGSGNPEEGELRPQLIDRFGLQVEIRTIDDLDQRVEIVERREAFERDPERFCAARRAEQTELRRRIQRARANVDRVALDRETLQKIAALCLRLKIHGHRGELTIARAARALAALEGRRAVAIDDVRRVVPMSLRHRLRRDPLEETAGGAPIDRAMDEILGPPQDEQPRPSPDHPQGDDDDGSWRRALQDGDGQPMESGLAAPGARRKRASAGRAAEEEPLPLPPLDARLPEGALDGLTRRKGPSAAASPAGRARNETALDLRRGRYQRAVAASGGQPRVALDATLRAAAPFQNARRASRPHRPFIVEARDLRYKLMSRKAGALYIFAVDASGSMALNRIRQAKGALAALLRLSYIRRDRIALITFREDRADLLLPPSHAPARANALLGTLPVGGATPLAAGLLRALDVAKRAALGGARECVLLVFTDGRANIPRHGLENEDRAAARRRIDAEIEQIGAALRRLKVSTVVVDTQCRFTSSGEGQALAARLGGRYIYLP